MSYEIGLRAIRLEPTDRLGHIDYCSNYALIRAVTGLDPRTDPGAITAFERAWDYDLIFSTPSGPIDWGKAGRVTDMGHAEFLEGGTDYRPSAVCPFRTVEEVWAFDAVAEYRPPAHAELVAYYERFWQAQQAAKPHLVFPGGYYRTIVSGAIQSFGWEMLLLAAADPKRFTKVLDGFFELTMLHVRAWAETSMEVFIQHDDMVWSQGPFMHPEIYRQVIFPRYAKLWEVLHTAGKTVLYCSDGTYDMFFDDLAAAGADGFFFEPMTSLEQAVDKFADTKCLISSKVDCRTLTFGTKEQIAAEVEQTVALARRCRGFLVAVGNHIPSNVPVDHARWYFDLLQERWGR